MIAPNAKAITAFLSSLVTLVAMFGIDLSAYLTPEVIGGIGMVATTILTWLIPNKA